MDKASSDVIAKRWERFEPYYLDAAVQDAPKVVLVLAMLELIEKVMP